MEAISPRVGRAARALRRPWVVAALALPAALVALNWWLVPPLDPAPAPVPVGPPGAATGTSAADVRPTWPGERLGGPEAKRLLLEILVDAGRRVDAASGYTATFRKQERIGDTLHPEQTLAMKVRHRPFAVYFKFLAPKPGKEVVYAEGYRDNKVIAHNGDWTRRLVPRLAIEPTSSVALAENRHPITEAGLANLVRKLVEFRRLDLEVPDSETVMDRTSDASGRPRLRSVHVHKRRDASRPFARVEVLYDPETLFPVQISSFDWPAPDGPPEPLLAERYVYEDLKIDAPLTAADFDPANPQYEFMRF